MSASNAFETELMNLLFLNDAIALIGDASGLQPSAAAGSLYLSLHTGDPGEAGDQTTSECAYTSYARVAVARTGAAWTVTGPTAANDAPITWPAATGGSETATYFGIGSSISGEGLLLFSGVLTESLAISSGITPEAAISGITVTAD